MPYINWVMKWYEKETASMGYLNCRKIKEMRKTVILVGKNWTYSKKEDLDNLFNSNISNKIHEYKKEHTNWFIHASNKNIKLYSYCSFIYYKYNIKIWKFVLLNIPINSCVHRLSGSRVLLFWIWICIEVRYFYFC